MSRLADGIVCVAHRGPEPERLPVTEIRQPGSLGGDRTLPGNGLTTEVCSVVDRKHPVAACHVTTTGVPKPADTPGE
jgi:hypothetical protein